MGKRYKKRKGRAVSKWELLNPAKEKENKEEKRLRLEEIEEEERLRLEEIEEKYRLYKERAYKRLFVYVSIIIGTYLLPIDENFQARLIEFLCILFGGLEYEMNKKH